MAYKTTVYKQQRHCSYYFDKKLADAIRHLRRFSGFTVGLADLDLFHRFGPANTLHRNAAYDFRFRMLWVSPRWSRLCRRHACAYNHCSDFIFLPIWSFVIVLSWYCLHRKNISCQFLSIIPKAIRSPSAKKRIALLFMILCSNSFRSYLSNDASNTLYCRQIISAASYFFGSNIGAFCS